MPLFSPSFQSTSFPSFQYLGTSRREKQNILAALHEIKSTGFLFCPDDDPTALEQNIENITVTALLKIFKEYAFCYENYMRVMEVLNTFGIPGLFSDFLPLFRVTRAALSGAPIASAYFSSFPSSSLHDYPTGHMLVISIPKRPNVSGTDVATLWERYVSTFAKRVSIPSSFDQLCLHDKGVIRQHYQLNNGNKIELLIDISKEMVSVLNVPTDAIHWDGEFFRCPFLDDMSEKNLTKTSVVKILDNYYKNSKDQKSNVFEGNQDAYRRWNELIKHGYIVDFLVLFKGITVSSAPPSSFSSFPPVTPVINNNNNNST